MVAGGDSDDERTNIVEIINLEDPTSTCTDLSSYPLHFVGAVSTVGPNENPIICGGNTLASSTKNCYIHEGTMWNSFPSMNEGRSFAAALPSPYPNKTHLLLVTGGLDDSGFSNTGEVLTEDGWQYMSKLLPVTFNSHCAVLVNATTAFLIGGYQSNKDAAANTYFFNSENENWIEGPQLLTVRGDHSCARIKTDGKSSQYSVIVAGGSNSNEGTLSSVELLELGSSEWVAGPELPEKILGSSMVEYSDGGVFYIGGYSEGRVLDTIFYLAHGKSEWVEMPQKLKIGTAWATSFLVPDEITNCS